jgi:hypothetical protein
MTTFAGAPAVCADAAELRRRHALSREAGARKIRGTGLC